MKAKDIPIPENWPALIRQAMIHTASLAHVDIIVSWSRSADSAIQNVQLKSKLDKLETKLAQKENQLRIISSRLTRVPAKRRPYYLPMERMDILTHKAACAWNLKQTAKEFQTDASTISSWMKRIDDESLIKIPVPWNKYPSYLKYVTRQLKLLVPRLGKKKIAEHFMRAGLYLAATTVGRYLKEEKPENTKGPEFPEFAEKLEPKKIKSKHPNHTWTVDLTAVPISGGFWTSWFPNSLPQYWPYCYWVAVVVDHFSRRAVGFALFKDPPTSMEVTEALDKAIERTGKAPKYIISDKGCQFYCENYKSWCKDNNIKPRFGAVGKHGSIAITERFIKSMKDEHTRIISVPMNSDDMRFELSLYFIWYNEYRPHEYLKGRTPEEIYNNSPPLKMIEFKKAPDIPEMELELSFLGGRKHLPIIEFKKAA